MLDILSGSIVAMILGEIAVLVGVGLWVVLRLNRRLRSKLADLVKRLKEVEASARQALQTATVEQIGQYLTAELAATRQHIDKVTDSDDSGVSESASILGCRITALEAELEALNDNAEVNWSQLEQSYACFLENTSSDDAVPIAEESGLMVLDDIAVIDPSEKSHGRVELADSVRTTAEEELGRLRGVISRQFSCIDELKNALREVGDSDNEDTKDAMLLIDDRLKQLINEQEQMAMCVKVLESENAYLHETIERLQADPNVELDSSAQEEESKTIQNMAKELQDQANLIRNLIQTNKEQLQCIATLEDAAENNSSARLDMKSIDSDDTFAPVKQLAEVRDLNDKLMQTNKEHLQCIAILEDKIEKLQLSAPDGEPQLPVDIENAGENSPLQAELSAKVAELELLQIDYEMLKAKYLEGIRQNQDVSQKTPKNQ